MSAHHSRLPLRVVRVRHVEDSGGYNVLSVIDANFAPHVVMAVNAHPDLLALLKELHAAHFTNNCDIAECGCKSSDLAARVEAAIATAEGK